MAASWLIHAPSFVMFDDAVESLLRRQAFVNKDCVGHVVDAECRACVDFFFRDGDRPFHSLRVVSRRITQAVFAATDVQVVLDSSSVFAPVAVCKLIGAGASKELPDLPLDQGAEPAKIGQAVMTIGVPAGADRLLSALPEGEAKWLLEQYGEEGPSLLNQLARRNIVKPLTSQGRLMDLYDDRVVYNAASGEGNSGAPFFGPSGHVIGIHFEFFEQNRLSNYAVPIGHGLALLRQVGWKSVN